MVLGHGIGLRREHFSRLLEDGPKGVDWLEVISENFFEPGGRPWAVLDRVRRDVPIATHGVSMGIGNVDPVPVDYLRRLARLIERAEPVLVSDHLCWGGSGGHHSHDLLPLPYTEEALANVVAQVHRVQDYLRRSILLENVSSYVAFRASAMTEHDFLVEVTRRTGARILLDVNNVYVSSKNHQFSAEQYLDAIPPELVGQIHLAGHTDKGTYILDSHVGPVPEPVWDLYRRAVARFGHVPALIEWDEQIPAYELVVAESERARSIEREVLEVRARAERAAGEARVVPWAETLRDLQSRFFELITARDGVEAGLRELARRDPGAEPIERWIVARDGEAARWRVEIYASMYFYRLLDVLREDFSKVRALIGEAHFHNLATHYLDEVRPSDPSLRHLGRALPDFLIDGRPAGALPPSRNSAAAAYVAKLCDRWPALSDLARMEWTRIAVFDERDAAPIDAAELGGVEPEAWPELAFAPIDAMRVIELDFPIHRIWDAEPAEWERILSAREPTSLVVWRRDFRVWHRPLGAEEKRALAGLAAREPFAAICERLIGDQDDFAAAAETAATLLHRWIDQGLIGAWSCSGERNRLRRGAETGRE